MSSVNPKGRAPLNLKRKGNRTVPLNERVQLDKVLGLTVSSNASVRTSEATGLVAYPAGCVVVLFNPKRNKQSFLINASKKSITSLAFSPDGKYLATGECGHLPNVRVWDVAERSQVGEFAGHKFAINCVAFSPNNKYVVSIGSQHDMIVNVWNWRAGTKVASNKVACKVKAISFAENGSYFVTAGNRHVKFWYLDDSKNSKAVDTVPLLGRSAILGEQRNNFFWDVACGRGQMCDSTYTISQSGLLCEFNSKRLLDKWVEVRTPSAHCLSVGSDYIFCGCSDGIVRVFSPFTLHFIATLPRPHYLGVDVAAGLSPSHMMNPPGKARYPDTIAVSFNSRLNLVTCMYADHSAYVWDVTNVKKVGKVWSALYHSGCIWGVETYPGAGSKSMLPPGTFATCSSDDTVRFWNLETHMSNETSYKRNIYSSELLKVIYVDKDLQFICDKDTSASTTSNNTTGSKTEDDGRNGVRSIRVSADGEHLASGDRAGNIRVHELQFMDELCKIEAHDAEVLYLEYSKNQTGDRLLASASRDRLIHVFDMDEDYAFQQTLDDHSASITAVRFTQAPQSELKMFSCSADKSIIFRTAHYQPDLQFVRNHHVFGKTTMYDLDIDPTSKHIVTACQDRNIRVYDIATGKQRKCYKGSTGEDGALIKLSLDPSGLYIATSCSDKNICLFDYSSGECVAVSYGHSELVTGLRFTNDCKNLISVSGDGCIFVWKLNPDLVRNMQIRLAQLGKMMNRNAQRDLRRTTFLKIPNTIMSETEPGSDESSEGDDTISMLSGHSANCNIPPKIPEDSSEETPDCRFSMGQVPSWAQKQMSGEGVLVKISTTDDNSPRHQPRGRWGQQGTEVKVRSIWDDEQLQQQQQQGGGGGGAQDSPGVSPIPAAIVKRRETFSGTPNSRHRHVSADSSEDEEALMNARNAHTSFSPVKQRRISDNYTASPRYGGLLMSRAAAKSLMNLSSISNTSNTSSERQKLSKLDLSNLAKSLTDLSSFDLDDLSKDAGDQPIVFQLPNEDDSSGETSYKVVEITAAVLREALKQPNQQLKAGSARHENTESPSDEETTTDQGESTDVGEDSSSTVTSASIPTTPSKVNKQFFGAHLEKDHMDKEKFIKSQYESGGGGGVSNLLTSQEKFGQSLDKVERRMESLVSATDAADHRLSISSRFLQRSQQSSARQLGYVAADQPSGEQKLFQRDSTPDAVFQKRTEELGKAMEATKKRLKSLGWRGSEKDLSEQTIPEKERDGGYERETPSPPTKDTTADTDLTRTKSLPDVSTIGHHRRRPLPTTHGDGESAYVPGAPSRQGDMRRSTSHDKLDAGGQGSAGGIASKVASYAQGTASSQAKINRSRSITNLNQPATDGKKSSSSDAAPGSAFARYKRLSYMMARSTPNLASASSSSSYDEKPSAAVAAVAATTTAAERKPAQTKLVRRASMSSSDAGKSPSGDQSVAPSGGNEQRVRAMLNKQPPFDTVAAATSPLGESLSPTRGRPVVPPRKKNVFSPGERSPIELPVKDMSPSPVRKVAEVTGRPQSAPVTPMEKRLPERPNRQHEISPRDPKAETVESCVKELHRAVSEATDMFHKVAQSETLSRDQQVGQMRQLVEAFQQTQDMVARCASQHIETLPIVELNSLRATLAQQASDPNSSVTLLQQYNELLFNLLMHKMSGKMYAASSV